MGQWDISTSGADSNTGHPKYLDHSQISQNRTKKTVFEESQSLDAGAGADFDVLVSDTLS